MKKKRYLFQNTLLLTEFLIFVINKFSGFFVFLPNTHFGNRAEDILNAHVHCKNLGKKPIIIFIFNIFSFIKKRNTKYLKIFLFFFSPAQQNNALCYLENENFPKQNIILKITMSIVATVEFYITRIFHLIIYTIFYYDINARRNINNLFSIKSISEYHFYKYLDKKNKKIKGYSTKELDIIKNGWYFRQFNNIDEEKKYIYKKLKINQNRW